MLKNSNNIKIYEKGLYFLSLGGIGEIGANCYLYCCDGKWIMIDLGLSFADEQFPGVDLLVPKINFLEDIKNNLEAIIISHGHEDHAGAVAYLSDKIECPVYASSFPKLLIENRLKEFGKLDSIDLIELDSSKNLLRDDAGFVPSIEILNISSFSLSRSKLICCIGYFFLNTWDTLINILLTGVVLTILTLSLWFILKAALLSTPPLTVFLKK